ncbi:hypothetical protein Taro_031638 [Colocasia esculenta]|uniref:Uncharacterized protein n=1 Tax=Colocasia esculenta TaxID=4460 RepID=A0A843W3Q8_COLES|nr:hypothetical protein [Colocasia esculenta]
MPLQSVGPFILDCKTERWFLCCVVWVGYWRHEPVVCSRVVASFLLTLALVVQLWYFMASGAVILSFFIKENPTPFEDTLSKSTFDFLVFFCPFAPLLFFGERLLKNSEISILLEERAPESSQMTPDQLVRLAKIPICPGKVVDFSRLSGSLAWVEDTLNAMGWTKLCQISEPIVENAVRTFYVTMEISSASSVFGYVKGTKISISEELLVEILECPNSGHKLNEVMPLEKQKLGIIGSLASLMIEPLVLDRSEVPVQTQEKEDQILISSSIPEPDGHEETINEVLRDIRGKRIASDDIPAEVEFEEREHLFSPSQFETRPRSQGESSNSLNSILDLLSKQQETLSVLQVQIEFVDAKFDSLSDEVKQVKDLLRQLVCQQGTSQPSGSSSSQQQEVPIEKQPEQQLDMDLESHVQDFVEPIVDQFEKPEPQAKQQSVEEQPHEQQKDLEQEADLVMIVFYPQEEYQQQSVSEKQRMAFDMTHLPLTDPCFTFLAYLSVYIFFLKACAYEVMDTSFTVQFTIIFGDSPMTDAKTPEATVLSITKHYGEALPHRRLDFRSQGEVLSSRATPRLHPLEFRAVVLPISLERGKSSWPELIGFPGRQAVGIIERENPRVEASTVPEGSFVTTDFRCDRVRVWVDKHGIVTRPPKIG